MQTPTGRTLRVLAGLLLVIYGGVYPSLAAIVGMMAGVVFVVTGAAGLPSPPRSRDRHVQETPGDAR